MIANDATFNDLLVIGKNPDIVEKKKEEATHQSHAGFATIVVITISIIIISFLYDIHCQMEVYVSISNEPCLVRVLKKKKKNKKKRKVNNLADRPANSRKIFLYFRIEKFC